MQVIFAGTPDFAVPTLSALVAAGHSVVAVYTQPDRPAGRGRKVQVSAVKQFALAKNLTVHQPTSLSSEAEIIQQLHADVMVVVAYGLILPTTILALPRLGCVNVHASLLPRWRGAAPIQRAIAAGDQQSGITIMQMDAGLDTGDMLLQTNTDILDDDTGGSLHDRLAELGAAALIETLTQLEAGNSTATPQNEKLTTYATKLSKSEGALDWQQGATSLSRLVRAFNPWPGCHCQWQGKTLRIHHAHVKEGAATEGEPGTIITADEDGITVNTASGQLVLTQIQLAGGKSLTASDFINGHHIAAGDRLT